MNKVQIAINVVLVAAVAALFAIVLGNKKECAAPKGKYIRGRQIVKRHRESQ